jgi:ABC-2 type transport system permease protein
VGFAVSVVLLRFSPPVSSVPPLALVVVVSTISCTAYGLALGAIAMRARDVFVLANLAVYLMWIFCGVNIPLSALPAGWRRSGAGCR